MSTPRVSPPPARPAPTLEPEALAPAREVPMPPRPFGRWEADLSDEGLDRWVATGRFEWRWVNPPAEEPLRAAA